MAFKSKRKGVTQRENKKTYPEGFDLLMSYGFKLSLLNVIFGLIPISIRGSKVSYSRISVVKLYGLVLLFTIVFASVVFVVKTTVLKLLEDTLVSGRSYVPTTYILAITLNVGAHVLGFLSLMLRGQVIGKRIPKVWQLLSKAVEKSIVKLHGKKYEGLLFLQQYCRRIYFVYFLTLVLNEFLVTTETYSFHADSDYTGFLFNAAYIFWDFATVSHVLTCMLLGFFMKTLEVCLMSVNETLEDVVEDIEHLTRTPPTLEEVQHLVAANHGVATIAQRLGFARNPCGTTGERTVVRIGVGEKDVVEKLNTIKDCYNAVEEAAESVSTVFGGSIFIEVLIIFGSSLSSSFFIFKQYFFRINKGIENKGEEDWSKYGDTTWQPLADIVVQFFFFSSLAIATTRMNNEAKKSVRIIRTLPYQSYPDNLQTKLVMLRNDLNSAEIRLTAADYFVVNKNLVITLCSTVVTFLVVLIQFNASDEEEPGTDQNKTTWPGPTL